MEDSTKIAGLYHQQYSKQFKNLSLTDCLIAGTANVNDLTLVSLNTKHFPMKDYEVTSFAYFNFSNSSMEIFTSLKIFLRSPTLTFSPE